MKTKHYIIIARGEIIGKPWMYSQKTNWAGDAVLLDEKCSIARAETIYENAKAHFESVTLFSNLRNGVLGFCVANYTDGEPEIKRI